MMKRFAAALAAGALCTAAQAQEKFEVKVAEFVGAQHFMTKWLMQWGEKLEKASNGRLAFKHFPNAQMAPTPAHYDLARTGQADVSWFLHGGTPGRFPLTEIVNLPVHGGQRRDRHQGAERSAAARQVPRRRAQGRARAAAAHAPAGQRLHHQEAGARHRRHEGHAHPLRLAHGARLHRRPGRDAGGRDADRDPRAAAERRARRRVHRLRRRGHRLQARRHRQVRGRDVFVRDLVRRRHEPGVPRQAAGRPEEAGGRLDEGRGEGSRRRLGRARLDRQEADRRRRRAGDQAVEGRGRASSARSARRSPRPS